MTDEELEEQHDLVLKLVSKFPEPRRAQVTAMLEGPVGAEYFLAPASSRLEYHDCFPGGLMVHSLGVVRNLKKLADCLAPGKFDNSTLAFVGLFHDLGKVGDGEQPGYIPQQSQWHRDKLGQMYTLNQACMPGPNAERGLFILQTQGIRVSQEEWLAIRLNDGMYDEGNRSGGFAMKEPDLALMLHWADRWACQQEKQDK